MTLETTVRHKIKEQLNYKACVQWCTGEDQLSCICQFLALFRHRLCFISLFWRLQSHMHAWSLIARAIETTWRGLWLCLCPHILQASRLQSALLQIYALIPVYVGTVANWWLEPCLKGQCHEIFCFWFFSWISFPPPAPDYPIRTVSNFFEKSLRYSQVNVHHRYQRHRWKPVSTTPAAKLPPVSTTPAANLPLVSATPAANFATSLASVVDTGGKFDIRCQRHRWQIMGAISVCWDLKVNLKAKMLL